MPERRQRRFPNIRFLPWLMLVAIGIAYSSTIVGPMGMHYVPMDQESAWLTFVVRATVWVNNGSDQRADWMGNLCMLIPFGCLLTAVIAPRRGAGPFTMLVALLLSTVFILAVKYAQLYFPPRTVTLNYMVAQVMGATIGIALFGLSHAHLVRLAWRRAGGARETLRTLLIVYMTAIFVFLLMPLDFALSADDLSYQWDRVPAGLLLLPGAGRSSIIQAALLATSALAMVPCGMLMVLAPRSRNRPFRAALAHGIAWQTAVFLLSLFVLSATPTLIALPVRIIGTAVGIRIMHWVIRQDPIALRQLLARWSWLAIPPYLFLLASVNGLVSTHWLSIDEARAAVHWLGLLPLYDYYIVSKADAAKNIVAHTVMYLPVGLLVWVRGSRPSLAFLLALLLAAVVETGRYFRPGLEGDINDVVLAAFAAMLTAELMPAVWHMLASVTLPHLVSNPAQGPGWRERAAAARLLEARAKRGADAEVENY
jgi:VanZ family protein